MRRSSLPELFRGFCGLVAESRRRLDGEGGSPSLAEAQAPLLDLLAAIDAGVEDQYATDPRSLQQVRYLLACFADDQITGSDGPHRDGWKEASLESQLFQSDHGGAEVFRRIDKLLAVGDPGRRDLAATYLLAITLGFGGCLTGSAGERAVGDYRQRLLAFAAPDRQDADAAPWLTPAAYRHTLGQLEAVRLPNLRLWRWLAAGALAVLVLVSLGVFSTETARLAAVIERVLSQSAP